MRVLTEEKPATASTKTQMAAPALGNLIKPATLPVDMSRPALSKEVGMARGGVSHDAAAIVASMCAMKSNEEVLALFDLVYNHILSRVTE